MSFSPAFKVLGKFTPGISARQIYGDPSWEEVYEVAAYLGAPVNGNDLSSAVEKLSNELTEQNRFLTANLFSDEITDSDMYIRSLFIREIVANNRRGRAD